MGKLKAKPLTESQRALVEAQVQAGWVEPWTNRVLPRAIIEIVGLEECVSAAWFIVVKAASIWTPDRECTFRSYAMSGVKKFLPSALGRRAPADAVWRQMPYLIDDRGREEPVAVHTEGRQHAETGSLLSIWCAPESRMLRACLDWRSRVVLYLRFVECLTLQEIGDSLGITRERARQIGEFAVQRLEQDRQRRAA